MDYCTKYYLQSKFERELRTIDFESKENQNKKKKTIEFLLEKGAKLSNDIYVSRLTEYAILCGWYNIFDILLKDLNSRQHMSNWGIYNLRLLLSSIGTQTVCLSMPIDQQQYTGQQISDKTMKCINQKKMFHMLIDSDILNAEILNVCRKDIIKACVDIEKKYIQDSFIANKLIEKFNIII